MTIHVAIGNSDDGLRQVDWSRFVHEADIVIRYWADEVYGYWLSEPSSQYQNACWAFGIYNTDPEHIERFKKVLAGLAKRFNQDSIAFNMSETEMVAAKT